MTNQSLWLPILFALALGVAGCGDSGSGGDGGSDGTGNTNGNGGVCSTVCNSECVGLLPATGGNVGACIDGCNASGVYDGCENEASAFVSCLENNGCQEAGLECVDQAASFGACIN